MNDVTRAQDLIGKDVYTREGERIGRVGNVYVDDDTRRPEWVTVRTGLFGMKESFVPLEGASTHESRINLDVSKDRIQQAPRVEAEHGHLSEQEGRDLYDYYGMRSAGTVPPRQAARPKPSQMPGARPPEPMSAPTGRHHRAEAESAPQQADPPPSGRAPQHRKE